MKFSVEIMLKISLLLAGGVSAVPSPVQQNVLLLSKLKAMKMVLKVQQ